MVIIIVIILLTFFGLNIFVFDSSGTDSYALWEKRALDIFLAYLYIKVTRFFSYDYDVVEDL